MMDYKYRDTGGIQCGKHELVLSTSTTRSSSVMSHDAPPFSMSPFRAATFGPSQFSATAPPTRHDFQSSSSFPSYFAPPSSMPAVTPQTSSYYPTNFPLPPSQPSYQPAIPPVHGTGQLIGNHSAPSYYPPPSFSPLAPPYRYPHYAGQTPPYSAQAMKSNQWEGFDKSNTSGAMKRDQWENSDRKSKLSRRDGPENMYYGRPEKRIRYSPPPSNRRIYFTSDNSSAQKQWSPTDMRKQIKLDPPRSCSSPKSDSEDEPNVCATPVYSYPESVPDSGKDSDSDCDSVSDDFPFRILEGHQYPKSKVPFIDTHCHLDYMYVRDKHYTSFSAFIKKRDFPANFSGAITCFCDPPSLQDEEYYNEVLSEAGVWGAFGLHPHNAPFFDNKILTMLIIANKHPKCVAWGEMGLDYTNQTTDEQKMVQKEVFAAQLKAALKLNKPVIIHGRDAQEDTFDLLKQYLPESHKIHLHCYNGTSEFAARIMEHFPNLFIGITGIVTYTSSTQLRGVVEDVPFDRILIETDAPFMRPYSKTYVDPQYPRSSTPGMGLFIAQRIADVKKVSIDDVLIQIRENVNTMYGI